MDLVFDECCWNSFRCYYQGGSKKGETIIGGLSGATGCYLSFSHAPPLNQLIRSLSDLFEPWVHYNHKSHKEREIAHSEAHKFAYDGPGDALNISELIAAPPNLPKSDDVIKLFDDALAPPGWPEKDVVEEIIGKIPRHAPHSNSKLKRSSDFEGVSTAKTQRRSGTADAGSSLRLQAWKE
ncbi:hypothetical protein NEOLEDRAFT_193257 [Neolentinus lepideus HHB14362 ss-1]|uniref:Uncharacterized protein n=1 Tax=Neolentinus lepideus HHB14362 ss-1 TaxID=1314782 RepID=A0A165MFT7_9AGAM|nr:hypothetical protein NEOLEDRAFT_193257 [Neolentinus lepideus HHB14362 ss-1]